MRKKEFGKVRWEKGSCVAVAEEARKKRDSSRAKSTGS